MEHYYTVPSLPFLAVTEDGKLLKIPTKHKLAVAFNSASGYVRYYTTYNGKAYQGNLHRLIAEVFVKPREGENIKNLEVNHKNGIKLDNRPENLEWVYDWENLKHAVDTGLRGGPWLPWARCLAKNITTGRVLSFRSITNLSKFLNIGSSSLLCILDSRHAGKRLRKGFLFKYDDGTDWPIVELGLIDRWAFKDIYFILDETTNEWIALGGLKPASAFLGIEPRSLDSFRKKDLLGNNIKVELINIEENQEIKNLIRRAMPHGNHSYRVSSVVDPTDIMVFDTIKKAASKIGVSDTGLVAYLERRQTNPTFYRGYIVERLLKTPE